MNTRVLRHKGKADCQPLQYTGCGLDDVFLLSGYEKHVTKHGEGIAIKDVDDLHRAIGVRLVHDKKALNGKEMRFLRKAMDLTQAALSEILGVSSQTVARWEKGETSVDGPAETAVRLLYMHHAGTLPAELMRTLQELAERDDNPAVRQFFTKKNGDWVAQAAAA